MISTISWRVPKSVPLTLQHRSLIHFLYHPRHHYSQWSRTHEQLVASWIWTGKSISLKRVLDSWIECQSGTGIKSERSIKINSTLALRKVLDSEAGSTLANSEKKFSPKEAAHRLRIAQELNPELKRYEQKKTRQIRWETAVKKIEETLTFVQSANSSVTNAPPLATTQSHLEERHCTSSFEAWYVCYYAFVYYRFYIGQVYKRGANSRYSSVESASTAQGLSWLSLRVYLPLQLVHTSYFPLYISNILF